MHRFTTRGNLTTQEGKYVSSYVKDDEVLFLREAGSLWQVVIKTGESKGKVIYIHPKNLTT